VGYKYFNFDPAKLSGKLQLRLRLTPEGVDGTILIMCDRPWVTQGGKKIGQIDLKADMPKTLTELTADIVNPSQLAGKHALFLVFKSDTKQQSLCQLADFVFD
jgi:hypothetical protein